MTSNFKIIKGKIAANKPDTLTATIDGNTTPSIKDLYHYLRGALSLPDYFGENLDALLDVLRDLSWVKKRHVDIVFINYQSFLNKETTETRRNVLKVFNQAAEEWKTATEKDKINFSLHAEDHPLFEKDLKASLV